MPDNWTSCFVRAESDEQAMAIGDHFTTRHGLLSRGDTSGSPGVILTCRSSSKKGAREKPTQACRKEIQEIIEKGNQVTFS